MLFSLLPPAPVPASRGFQASGASRRKTFQHFEFLCVCLCVFFHSPDLTRTHKHTLQNSHDRFCLLSTSCLTRSPLPINTHTTPSLRCCSVMDFPASVPPSLPPEAPSPKCVGGGFSSRDNQQIKTRVRVEGLSFPCMCSLSLTLRVCLSASLRFM